jgi:hypothetical protein
MPHVAVLCNSAQKLIFSSRVVDFMLLHLERHELLDHESTHSFQLDDPANPSTHYCPAFRSPRKSKIPAIKFTFSIGWLIELDECRLIMPILKELDRQIRRDPQWFAPVHELLKFHRDAIKYGGYRLYNGSTFFDGVEISYETEARSS